VKEQHFFKTSFATALAMAVLMTGLVRLLFFATGQNFEWVYYLIFFGSVLVFSILIFRYLYIRYVYSNLSQIYERILALRNRSGFSRSFHGSIPGIRLEINRLLDEWSEASREEIDQLKQVETYRREFLGNVSHELKTPLFSVQGYIHTLIDGGIEDQDINMHYLGRASKGIDRLVHIVEDLESISRLESGELIVEKRTFELIDLVRDVIDSLELMAVDKKVGLEVKHDGTDQTFVSADKDMIRQVLVNLIVNSIKYGKQGGRTVVYVHPGTEKVLVEVRDDGIGIEKRHLGRLFERFYRVDSARSRERGGTGLGLAIVKHIVEAHGESIQVASEYGVGTTFSFTLPVSR
jgi:two-component system phosphate regulon sensor histidine kinase PhoR